MTDSPWKLYRKLATVPMRPWTPLDGNRNTLLTRGISVTAVDTPGPGGMIARNPDNPTDQWYVAREYFEANYEEVPDYA